MFADFLTIYDIHRWLRSVTWVGLVCVVGVCLVCEGGLPPQSWLFLLRTLLALPTFWSASGPSSLVRLVEPLVWSLIWLCLWYVLIRVLLALFYHHKQRALQMAQQTTGSWLPSRRLALAVSSSRAGGPGMAVPRLHLPQRAPGQVTGSLPASQILPDVENVPTRPASAPQLTVPLVTEPTRVLPLQVGVGWHAGLTRRHAPNEDSVAVLQGTYTYQGQLLPFGLFVVADGMGGHEDGLVASQIAMQSMSHTVLQNIIMGKEFSDAFFKDMLIAGAEWANMAIYQRAQSEGIAMGTTLTAALVIDMKAYIVNVGDSRTYLFRDSAGLIQITQDHSLVASLVAFGHITPDEIYTHPDRSQIYRSLGQGDGLKVDAFAITLQPADCLLLCSDGLWEMVRDPAIERIVRSQDTPHRLCERLVQTALRGGGHDNISVITVQV